MKKLICSACAMIMVSSAPFEVYGSHTSSPGTYSGLPKNLPMIFAPYKAPGEKPKPCDAGNKNQTPVPAEAKKNQTPVPAELNKDEAVTSFMDGIAGSALDSATWGARTAQDQEPRYAPNGQPLNDTAVFACQLGLVVDYARQIYGSYLNKEIEVVPPSLLNVRNAALANDGSWKLTKAGINAMLAVLKSWRVDENNKRFAPKLPRSALINGRIMPAW